jgi:hypothetical protein
VLRQGKALFPFRLLERRHRRVEFVSLTRPIDRPSRSRRRPERVVRSSRFSFSAAVFHAAASACAAATTTVVMVSSHVIIIVVVVASALAFRRIVARALGEIVLGTGFDPRPGFFVERHVELGRVAH